MSVIGAGTMGMSIAQWLAFSGVGVTLNSRSDESLRTFVCSVEKYYEGRVRRGRIGEEEARRNLAACHWTKAFEGLENADLVIESVAENLALKKAIFRQIDDICPDRTILASNTSSLSITRIGRATGRRDRVIGIHFFNPVAAMPLVEVIRGRDTSRETEKRAVALVGSLGKEAIRVFDTPGFATSRLGVALGLEAMRMVEEGVACAADIDRAMELGYGHRMGPLKTSDLVGLDVRLAIAETLAAELPSERFTPPGILQALVAEGRTGKK